MKLYPEFGPYLQDSMVAETRAYFRELLNQNLDARHLVKSDFVMVNEKLAKHYGIAGVSGAQIRRVPLPADCPRGGFLTQGAILKVTANGTTTSPVPRGAFVMDRIFGQPPEPPPANVAAVEPDVRGATTIRELLDKHRNNATCASCTQSSTRRALPWRASMSSAAGARATGPLARATPRRAGGSTRSSASASSSAPPWMPAARCRMSASSPTSASSKRSPPPTSRCC